MLTRPKLIKSTIRSLAALFTNLSAAWFATAFVVPNFQNNPNWPVILTGDVVLGIVSLIVSIILDSFID